MLLSWTTNKTPLKTPVLNCLCQLIEKLHKLFSSLQNTTVICYAAVFGCKVDYYWYCQTTYQWKSFNRTLLCLVQPKQRASQSLGQELLSKLPCGTVNVLERTSFLLLKIWKPFVQHLFIYTYIFLLSITSKNYGSDSQTSQTHSPFFNCSEFNSTLFQKQMYLAVPLCQHTWFPSLVCEPTCIELFYTMATQSSPPHTQEENPCPCRPHTFPVVQSCPLFSPSQLGLPGALLAASSRDPFEAAVLIQWLILLQWRGRTERRESRQTHPALVIHCSTILRHASAPSCIMFIIYKSHRMRRTGSLAVANQLQLPGDSGLNADKPNTRRCTCSRAVSQVCSHNSTGALAFLKGSHRTQGFHSTLVENQ